MIAGSPGPGRIGRIPGRVTGAPTGHQEGREAGLIGEASAADHVRWTIRTWDDPRDQDRIRSVADDPLPGPQQRNIVRLGVVDGCRRGGRCVLKLLRMRRSIYF